MDYCALQKLTQDSSKSQYVFNTALFHCHQIDSYMERHSIFEILGELMIQICIDRPEDVVEYLCRKLIEISQKLVKNVARLEFYNSTVDGLQMIKKLSEQRGIPVIECVTDKFDSSRSMKELDKFLENNSQQNHHFIISDFKETDKNEKFLRIYRNTSQGENSQQCPSKPQDSRSFRQINYIYENISSVKPRKMIKRNDRVLIVGRVGAGKKTQGYQMAKEFGLTFIDLDYLIQEYDQRPSSFSKNICGFWGFLQETLLKPNSIQNGFVIVCNVISRKNLGILMEKFIYGPNRIIFMHTSEKECWRRWQRKTAYQEERIAFNYQLNLYHLYKREFVEYFTSTKRKLIHINGNKSVHEIKTLIWAIFSSF